MGLFDWVPTVDEVFNFVECRVMDHEWVKVKINGHICRKCKTCGKIEGNQDDD